MAKKKEVDYKVISEFIQLLEGLERFLSPPLNANKDLLMFIRRLRDVLAANKNISSVILLNNIEKLSGTKNKVLKQDGLKAIKEHLNDMSIQDIESLLEDEALSKNDLLYIAEVRFEAPPGTLKRLKITNLREKLRGMIKNEKSHQSIAKVASSISVEPSKDYDLKNQTEKDK